MYILGHFFNINKPFEKANFGIIVNIDKDDDCLKYHVFLYDNNKNLLRASWVSKEEIAELENELVVGDKVRMVNIMDGGYLNDNAVEAEYGIITEVDEKDTKGMPYNVMFYKNGEKWIDFWCAGRQLQKVED